MAPHISIPQARPLPRRHAVVFIVLLGVVSLFAGMTYEGARSLTGPYLELLGASAAVVGIASGFGELVGYALRLVSGLVSDHTGRYWTVTIFGYTLNLFVVPLLAVIGRWELAVALMTAERMGRAIRSPARDAMLSHASSQSGLVREGDWLRAGGNIVLSVILCLIAVAVGHIAAASLNQLEMVR